MSAPAPQRAAAPGGGEGEAIWPRLRRGLRMELAFAESGGFPNLIITDPLRGRYYRAGWPQSGLFLLWNEAENGADLKRLMLQTYRCEVSDAEIAQAIDFALKNELTETDEKGGWRRYAQVAAASKHTLGQKLIHNYLFFRIPLLHPDAALRRLLPYLRFVYTRAFWAVVCTVAAAGLYLTTRQWNDVVEAFRNSLHFQQIFIWATALLMLKGLHELGHALTTVRYGCRVPSMGVAFILGAPVLYTDTSDSWRLSNDRQRLVIVFAGVAAELIVASIALLIWPLLPEGMAREVCFGFATAALAMTLAVNLNPFMRFDGYFALSDFLKVANLQPRAFALGAWRLREALFGLGERAPETFSPRLQRFLILYAYAVWIYRLFLFLGIAYVVYVMAGKAIGIVLGLFEVVMFILLPIWREVGQWWKRRTTIRGSRRALLTAAACAALATLFCLPLVRSVQTPGVLVAVAEQEVHVPSAAMLTKVAVTEGQIVAAGDVLFEAVAPDLEHKLLKARLEVRLYELRLARLIGNKDDHEQTVILQQEHKASRERVRGLRQEIDALKIKAPFPGRITDLDTALSPGNWVAPENLLARITDAQGARVKALVADEDLPRIASGARGVFVADEADIAAHDVVLDAIAPASDGTLAEPVLADVHGGQVASAMEQRVVKVKHGWAEVAFRAPQANAPVRLVRGVVRVEAEPQSALDIVWRQIGRVLVREQGF